MIIIGKLVRWRKVHEADRSSLRARTEADTDSAGRLNLLTAGQGFIAPCQSVLNASFAVLSSTTRRHVVEGSADAGSIAMRLLKVPNSALSASGGHQPQARPRQSWLDPAFALSYSCPRIALSDFWITVTIASNYVFEDPALARLCPYPPATLPARVLTTTRTRGTM